MANDEMNKLIDTIKCHKHGWADALDEEITQIVDVIEDWNDGPVRLLAGASEGGVLILALDMLPAEMKMSADLFDKIYKYDAKICSSSENEGKTRKDIDIIMDKKFGKETMRQFTAELIGQIKATMDEKQIAHEAK